jgi:hypothetical protein
MSAVDDGSQEGGRQGDVSARALCVARVIDRLCRMPGTYVMMLTVPAHRRAPWIVEFYRAEGLQRWEAGRGE